MKIVAFIGTHFPEKNATAAGWRLHQIICFFQKGDYDSHFLATSETPNSNEFQGIKTHKITVNCSSFDQLIQMINPDVVIFDRFIAEEQFGWRVTENCPKALKILDTEDLHFLRKQREDLYLKNKISKKTTDIFKREMASILRCDLSIIISKFEYQLLTNDYKISENQLFYLPFVYAEPKIQKVNPFSERKNFVFIGNFLHEPNWQTVLVLKRIWPSIKAKLQDVELHIYGAYMPEKAKQLADKKSGFLMKGLADDVEILFNNYRVLLAPIPYGAGLKGKLFESMVYGLPNMTTTFGAEGFSFNENWNGFISDDLTIEFIEKTFVLYNDESTWQKKQKIGFDIINQNYREDAFEKAFLKYINDLKRDLTRHREKHYLIGVLNHQTMQSTKFMNKWIEEKAKG